MTDRCGETVAAAGWVGVVCNRPAGHDGHHMVLSDLDDPKLGYTFKDGTSRTARETVEFLLRERVRQTGELDEARQAAEGIRNHLWVLGDWRPGFTLDDFTAKYKFPWETS